MKINTLKIIIYCFASILIIFSCNNKNSSSKGGLTDLLKYGIPYSIKAPSDVAITKIGKGELSDVSIKNNSGYDLQIFMGSASTSDLKKNHRF
ncbi:MAG: hypothetical protein IPO98_20520 [Saprospiraceae bacterium]|nr:hypothetical protein [Saprospiraceae bacterium]